MSASLVGSEMCIRDRFLPEQQLARLQSRHQQHVQCVLACAEASAEAERPKVASAEQEAQIL
eukprot:13655642-Alexandrium_andersonii.AAC.1